MPSNAAASSDAVPLRFAAMVAAFRTTGTLVAAFIVISSATVAGVVPVMVCVDVNVVMPSNAAARSTAERLRFAALVSAFRATAPLVAVFIVVS